MRKAIFLKWSMLGICLFIALAAIFQIGRLVGLTIYSNDFTINSIEIWQTGLISAGICAVFEFISIMKKLKVSHKHS